jgi:hypothetical protein
MRTPGIALLLVVLHGCAAEDAAKGAAKEVAKERREGLAPLLHMRADSEKTVREAAQALAKDGIPTELAPVADLEPEEIPEWMGDVEDGWVLFGKAEDRRRAEKALAAWWEELKKNAPPPPAKVVPLALGTRREVAAEEVKKIQAELARRRTLDQAVRRDRSRHGEMAKVDADNTSYIKEVITDVGWIDVARFDQGAADAAFLLVQHSGDLSLMLAALPEIEKDVRAGRADGQNFALLYDRTQLMSGGKQRYGSQVRETENGGLVVYKLEDPDRVDARRKALGLGPLRDYLALFGGDVKIER